MKQYTDLDSREQNLWCELTNFIEWYASEEEDREPLRQSMQLYLQQEIWIELEGMELKQIGQFIDLKKGTQK